MRVHFSDVAAGIRLDREDYLAAIAAVIDSGGFIGGPEVSSFEADFARYVGTPHAIAVRSGTEALLLALRAIGIGSGDEVITAANSYFATAEAIALSGAKPILCDVHEDTLLIDVDDAVRRMTARTRAIIPVHLHGQMANMDEILALARQFNLKVLEDCAQAHGAAALSKCGELWSAGVMGDAAAFSFFPSKNLAAFGEGGAVTTKSAELANEIMLLRNHGQVEKNVHVRIGSNARLDAIQCASLRISLRRLDERNAARQRVASMYSARLSQLPNVKLTSVTKGSRPVYHQYVVRVDASRRDHIRERMEADGIETSVHYPVPIHLQPAFSELNQGVGTCPRAERAATQMISLPIYPTLSEEDVNAVVEALQRSLER